MRTLSLLLAGSGVILACAHALGATRYVNLNNPAPAAPYLSWSTAATNIQDAVDFAAPGETVLVSNGTYRAGWRVSPDGATNRVVVTNAIKLQSASGAGSTLVDGGGAVRCLYLAAGATLSSFTLTNGAATSGAGLYAESTNAFIKDCVVTRNAAGKTAGGAYCGSFSNCTFTGNSAGLYGTAGGVYSAILVNCTISGNAVANMGSGGGASGCVLSNCVISGNTTGSGLSGTTVGGGATGSTLYNCAINGNSSRGAGAAGGGVYECTLFNCGITNNSADYGPGGADTCVMTNCVLQGNSGSWGGGMTGGSLINGKLINNRASYGGGAYWYDVLTNCVLIGNSAGYGGGASSCTLYSCTLYNNGSSVSTGGGAYYSTLYNSIVYYSKGSDINTCALYNSCAPGVSGNGNISAAPQFVNAAGNDLHLAAGSPCINAGSNAYVATVTDLDANLRIVDGSVDIGAYEYHLASPLTVGIQANYTNVVIGYPVTFLGVYNGGVSNRWDFGDGSYATNLLRVSHAWSALEDFQVTLTVYDSNYPDGVDGTFTVHVIAPPNAYVSLTSSNPVAPYTSWDTAAPDIQSAIDAVDPGWHIIVTNGVYDSGGRVVYGAHTNRIAINKPVLVQSVNGSSATLLVGNPAVGDGAVRCAYLTNGATLSGFTLLNGATRAAGDAIKEQSGGAIWCESTNAAILDCLIISNTANVYGGGIRGGSLTNCSLIANATVGSGGAAYGSVLQGCLVSNNTAIITYGGISGGGASSCTLVSCMVVSNITDTPWAHPASGGGAVDSTLVDCSLIGNTGKDGGGANNCTLRNCTLLNNLAGSGGGGAAGSTMINCSMISNSAALGGGLAGGSGTNCVVQGNTSGYQGGGACGSVLHNSLITGNSSTASAGGGGGPDPSGVPCTFVNCVVYGNSAYYSGGGVFSATVWNSIILSNTANDSPNWNGGSLNYCCTTPLPTGNGNITNSPLFADPSAADYHLQSPSPCINAGNNAPVALSTDLDGNARIKGGTVDLGPYEVQSPQSVLSYAWAQQYGLPLDGTADYADIDGDGFNNWQEWRCATDPTNRVSCLALLTPAGATNGVVVSWQSGSGILYSLQRATALTAQPGFSLLRSNIIGQAGTTSYTDTNTAGSGPFFYRVFVQ